MIERLMPYLLVGAGSFVGGNARFILARWVGGVIDARFPLGTFLFEDGVWLPAVTNMLPSLFAGLLAVRFGVVAAKSWL